MSGVSWREMLRVRSVEENWTSGTGLGPVIVYLGGGNLMFQGLRSAIYYVADLERATMWYTQVLGIAPYFSESFYVGFNVGGFELGLHPDATASLTGLGGAVPYWGVADASVSHDRLVSLGAETLTPVQEVGGGIKVAVVKDPFGNALGIIENPHFTMPS